MNESYYPAHARVEAWRTVPDPRSVELRRRTDPVYMRGARAEIEASSFSGAPHGGFRKKVTEAVAKGLRLPTRAEQAASIAREIEAAGFSNFSEAYAALSR